MKNTEEMNLRNKIIEAIIGRVPDEFKEEFEKDFGPILRKELISTFPTKYRSRSISYEEPFKFDDKSFSTQMNAGLFREIVINTQGYVMATTRFCKSLAKFIGKDSKVLEIMSGSGALAYGLRKEGVQVIATDNFSNYAEALLWTNVENIDAIAAVKKYAAQVDYLLVTWPPYQNPIIDKVLEVVATINPTLNIIHIGEMNGCTGTETMWECLIPVVDTRFRGVCNAYHTWDMFHDVPGLYKINRNMLKEYIETLKKTSQYLFQKHYIKGNNEILDVFYKSSNGELKVIRISFDNNSSKTLFCDYLAIEGKLHLQSKRVSKQIDAFLLEFNELFN